MLNRILKGTAGILQRIADRVPETVEDRVAEQVRIQSVSKNKDLQMVLNAFAIKYGTGIQGVRVSPMVEKETLNVVGWTATLGKNTIYKANGLNDIYEFFLEGTLTRDKEKIENYKEAVKVALEWK